MAGKLTYTDDDVHAIIDRALKSERDRDLTHEQLVSIASEVGISREAIDAAAVEIQTERVRTEAKRHVIRRRRRLLASHIWTFVAINGFLFAINYLSTPGEWWVLFPLMIWGLALAFHLRFGLSRQVSPPALKHELARMRPEGRAGSATSVPKRRVATVAPPASAVPEEQLALEEEGEDRGSRSSREQRS